MEGKARIGWSALWIVGLVFSGIGSLFALLGVFFLVLRLSETRLLGLIFGGEGLLFLALGLPFVFAEIRKKRFHEQLVASGRYLWGEIAEVVPNYLVTINRSHPLVLIVQYLDPMGGRHVFKSVSVHGFSESQVIGKRVKVYYQAGCFDRYYVDIDSIL